MSRKHFGRVLQVGPKEDRLIKKSKVLNKQVQGTYFYMEYQDSKSKPNIFNTRQSFLLQMNDPILLEKFLNSFNTLHLLRKFLSF